MADLALRTAPATRAALAVHADGWLKLLPTATRLAFYGDAAARAAALTVWGVEFSETACRANVGESRATFWLGPDEYLLLDAGAEHSEIDRLMTDLEHALSGIPHALVDISHRQFALQIAGPYATTILSGACPLDLDLSEFPIGMCTRTVFAKADIVLWRTGEDDFHLEVWRSFSGYVLGVLQEIAAEFYPEP